MNLLDFDWNEIALEVDGQVVAVVPVLFPAEEEDA